MKFGGTGWVARWTVGLLACGSLAVLGRPAASQNVPFRFLPPATQEAVDRFLVTWSDDSDEDPAGSLASITWYYSTTRDGTDRKRVATEFRDDFSKGFLARWKAMGPFLFDWAVGTAGEGRTKFPVLKGGRQNGPIVLKEPLPRHAVISMRVRPTGIKNEFGIGFRTQPNAEGFELRNRGLDAVIKDGGTELVSEDLREASFPNRWYWYEISFRNESKKAVDIRARIYDDKHSKVLVNFERALKVPSSKTLLDGGSMAIWGPVEVAEIYVDPWASHWVDGRQNQMTWDTSEVPAGKYYLIAEIDDGQRRPIRYTSPYQVEVRKSAVVSTDD